MVGGWGGGRSGDLWKPLATLLQEAFGLFAVSLEVSLVLYGVSITKRCPWRGGNEEFANVYHYNLAANLNETLADDLINQLKTAEVLVHGSNVTFVQGRVWEAGGTAPQNETILIKDLSGVGAFPVSVPIYRELCYVIRFDTERNTSTGRKIYLRKYIHATGINSVNAGAQEGTTVLNTGNKAPFLTYGQNIRQLSLSPGTIEVFLSAQGGQQVSDSTLVEVNDWLHIRQFKQ